MTPILRCATYARYSSSQQRDASIVDQQRNMMRYAETKGWRILTDFMFSDEAISGAGLDRPGFQQLLRAAKASPRVIDVILVDDTSRISRSLADTVRLREDLNFTGIRFVAVSQGIDSDDEQADVMMTVYGLVDSLYIKELAKKTHRGLEGLALKGFHTGGSCFGYRSEKLDGGSQLQIVEEEAAVVRRIFHMSASGLSLKLIAKGTQRRRNPAPEGDKEEGSAELGLHSDPGDAQAGYLSWQGYLEQAKVQETPRDKQEDQCSPPREPVGCHRETGAEDCAARPMGSRSSEPQGHRCQVSRNETWTSKPIHQRPLPLQRNSQMRRMRG